jgi:hypothetical protein
MALGGERSPASRSRWSAAPCAPPRASRGRGGRPCPVRERRGVRDDRRCSVRALSRASGRRQPAAHRRSARTSRRQRITQDIADTASSHQTR